MPRRDSCRAPGRDPWQLAHRKLRSSPFLRRSLRSQVAAPHDRSEFAGNRHPPIPIGFGRPFAVPSWSGVSSLPWRSQAC